MIIRGYFAIAIGLTLLMAACTSTSEPDPGPDQPGTLVGVWIFEEQTDDGAKVYHRAAALTGDRSGYEFAEHGGLKVRTSGWCETPIIWHNLEGLWNHTGDRLLDIHHTIRGGSKEYQLEIITLTSRRLVCRERTGDGF